MSVIRSNKACRASVVVVCLAYHELVQRVRKDAHKNAKLANQNGPQPPNWTSVATDAVHNSKAPKPREDGMSHAVLSMFPRDAEDEGQRPSHRSSPEGSAEDRRASRGGDMRRDDEDDGEEDDEDEPEEEISTIERRRTTPKSPTKRMSSERYGATSSLVAATLLNGLRSMPRVT